MPRSQTRAFSFPPYEGRCPEGADEGWCEERGAADKVLKALLFSSPRFVQHPSSGRCAATFSRKGRRKRAPPCINANKADRALEGMADSRIKGWSQSGNCHDVSCGRQWRAAGKRTTRSSGRSFATLVLAARTAEP